MRNCFRTVVGVQEHLRRVRRLEYGDVVCCNDMDGHYAVIDPMHTVGNALMVEVVPIKLTDKGYTIDTHLSYKVDVMSITVGKSSQDYLDLINMLEDRYADE